MSQTRWFAVDDRSSEVSYSGSWSETDGSQYNGAGSFGATYLDTVHRTTSTGASVSFTFIGDAARIMGTHNVRSPTTNPDPSWRCYLDGQEFTKEKPATSTQNNQAFCKFYNLSPGRHTIRVEAISNGQPLVFDQIQYRPTVAVNNGVAWISRYDPDILYDSSWQGLGDVARMTTIHGSVMDFWFTGNRLTWMGMYPNQLPHEDAPASYSIDNGPPIPFTVRGGGGNSDYNRQIFQTARLSQGQHHVRVTYQGGTNRTPLVLANLLVDGGTTRLLGIPSPSNGGGGDSGGGSSGGTGSSTTSTDRSDEGTETTTSPRGSITVTRVPDAQIDLPDADDLSDLVTGTLTIHTGTLTDTQGVTVYTLDPNSQAGNPNDQDTSPTMTAAVSQGFPVAAIVGIVLGILLALALGGLFLFWRRNKRRRHLQLPDSPNSVQPFHTNGGASSRRPSSTAHSYGSGSALSMQQTEGPSIHSGVRSPAFSPNRYTQYTASESSAASDFASSSSNLLQPVRKDRNFFSSPSSESRASSDIAANPGGPVSSGSRVIMHEDSGVRMARPISAVEEVPPMYTPG